LLYHLSCSAATKKFADPKGRIPRRGGITLSDPRYGLPIEVIVMVVRESNNVDRRQAIKFHSWRNPTPGSGKLNRRRPLTPDGIQQNIEASDLDEEARVANPSQRKLLGRRSWHNEARISQSELARLWVRTAWIPPSLDQRPLQKVREAVHLSGRPRIPESALGQMVAGRLQVLVIQERIHPMSRSLSGL